eukprot:scaffold24653_cov157-Cylindrotheca_fusiformis.AAC.5
MAVTNEHSPRRESLTSQSASAVNNNSGNNNNNNNNSSRDESYNPRWKGYVLLGVASLINFLSIATLEKENLDNWGAAMVFGLWTFLVSLAIVLQDRTQLHCCCDPGTFHKNKKIEGWTLFLLTIWCSIGVGYQTCVDGIAYRAHNIYYSSWASLAACVYTLNEWSAAHDLLSFQEMTSLSLTLRSWYTCWFFGVVVLFTSVDILVHLQDDVNVDDASFGIFLGVATALISAFFIFVHYNFFPSVEEGGWLELSSSFILILLWTIALAIMTQDRGIAATLSGYQCNNINDIFAPQFRDTDDYPPYIFDPTSFAVKKVQDMLGKDVQYDDDEFVSSCMISFEVKSDDTFPPSDIPSDGPSTAPSTAPSSSAPSSAATIDATTNTTTDGTTNTTNATDAPTISTSPSSAPTGIAMEIVQVPCSEIFPPPEQTSPPLTDDEVPSRRSWRRGIPGSNMYFAAWICFFASLNVTFRWKAAQALQFAQTQREEEKEQQRRRTQQRLQHDTSSTDDGRPFDGNNNNNNSSSSSSIGSIVDGDSSGDEDDQTTAHA